MRHLPRASSYVRSSLAASLRYKTQRPLHGNFVSVHLPPATVTPSPLEPTVTFNIRSSLHSQMSSRSATNAAARRRVATLPNGVDLPPGWSNDDADAEWLASSFPFDSFPLQDVLLVAEKAELNLALIESGGRYFLWNTISDDVVRVEEPTDLSELLTRLAGDRNSWILRTSELEELPVRAEDHVELDPDAKARRERNQTLSESSDSA